VRDAGQRRRIERFTSVRGHERELRPGLPLVPDLRHPAEGLPPHPAQAPACGGHRMSIRRHTARCSGNHTVVPAGRGVRPSRLIVQHRFRGPRRTGPAPGPSAIGIDETRQGKPVWKQSPARQKWELVTDAWHFRFVDAIGGHILSGRRHPMHIAPRSKRVTPSASEPSPTNASPRAGQPHGGANGRHTPTKSEDPGK
jgi:hypothetical protein